MDSPQSTPPFPIFAITPILIAAANISFPLISEIITTIMFSGEV
jgi:hypothetical protein